MTYIKEQQHPPTRSSRIDEDHLHAPETRAHEQVRHRKTLTKSGKKSPPVDPGPDAVDHVHPFLLVEKEVQEKPDQKLQCPTCPHSFTTQSFLSNHKKWKYKDHVVRTKQNKTKGPG
eukprot:gene23705-1482_t